MRVSLRVACAEPAARRRALPRRALAAVVLLGMTAATLSAHDMFWRLTSYFVAPQTGVQLPVLNGTFSKSANAIEWSRVADLSIVSPAGRVPMDSAHWNTRSDTSVLSYTTGASGTYAAGLSTKPRDFSLAAAAFNQYLADDGIPDILAQRRKDGSLKRDARERYSKHIKAIFQVGDTRSDGWSVPLGYPAELVPLANPYTLKAGATLGFRVLVDGQPIAGQLVLVGGRRGSTGDTRLPATSLRSDRAGIVRVALTAPGRWYVKFIHMVPRSNDVVDYESKWATITFEVR
jgi:hypothetical protein